jgi:hypothetical protein
MKNKQLATCSANNKSPNFITYLQNKITHFYKKANHSSQLLQPKPSNTHDNSKINPPSKITLFIIKISEHKLSPISIIKPINTNGINQP